MLLQFPVELVLRIATYLPIPCILDLRLTCQSLRTIFDLDQNEQWVFHHVAYRNGWIKGVEEGFEVLVNQRYSVQALSGVENGSWKSFCKKRFLIENAWRGSSGSRTDLRRLHATDESVHRIKVDEKEGIILHTNSDGGLMVTNMAADAFLWSLPQTYVRGWAHCEYGNGFVIFDRITGDKEVWRLKKHVIRELREDSPTQSEILDDESHPTSCLPGLHFQRAWNSYPFQDPVAWVPPGVIKSSAPDPTQLRAFMQVEDGLYRRLMPSSGDPLEEDEDEVGDGPFGQGLHPDLGNVAGILNGLNIPQDGMTPENLLSALAVLFPPLGETPEPTFGMPGAFDDSLLNPPPLDTSPLQSPHPFSLPTYGHFVPWAIIHVEETTRAFRFVYPHLLAASANTAFLWDVRTGELIQKISGVQFTMGLNQGGMAVQAPAVLPLLLGGPTDPAPLPTATSITENAASMAGSGAKGGLTNLQPVTIVNQLRYVEFSERHVFICGKRVLRVFSRETGRSILDIVTPDNVHDGRGGRWWERKGLKAKLVHPQEFNGHVAVLIPPSESSTGQGAAEQDQSSEAQDKNLMDVDESDESGGAPINENRRQWYYLLGKSKFGDVRMDARVSADGLGRMSEYVRRGDEATRHLWNWFQRPEWRGVVPHRVVKRDKGLELPPEPDEQEFLAVHVSECGKHLVALLTGSKVFIIYNFEEAIRDDTLDIALLEVQLGVPSRESQYLAFDNGRIAVATGNGIFILHPDWSNPPTPTSTPEIEISRIRAFYDPSSLDAISCLQLSDTGLYVNWDTTRLGSKNDLEESEEELDDLVEDMIMFADDDEELETALNCTPSRDLHGAMFSTVHVVDFSCDDRTSS